MNHTSDKITGFGFGAMVGIDTTLVLFFLALEYGRAVQMLSVDGLLMGITMLMVLTLPYFLPSRYEKPPFANWMIGRGTIALCGVLLGIAFKQSLGVVLPESMRFMPMTFLILAAMVSCYIQFYGLMKLRLAK
ncbi:MAG: hypothetical protein ABIO36_04815 [Pyrinomonadaceae bacterium]